MLVVLFRLPFARIHALEQPIRGQDLLKCEKNDDVDEKLNKSEVLNTHFVKYRAGEIFEFRN